MKKNYFYFLSSFQKNISLETATFLAAMGYAMAILLVCVLR
jgi:hypothetical protein